MAVFSKKSKFRIGCFLNILGIKWAVRKHRDGKNSRPWCRKHVRNTPKQMQKKQITDSSCYIYFVLIIWAQFEDCLLVLLDYLLGRNHAALSSTSSSPKFSRTISSLSLKAELKSCGVPIYHKVAVPLLTEFNTEFRGSKKLEFQVKEGFSLLYSETMEFEDM